MVVKSNERRTTRDAANKELKEIVRVGMLLFVNILNHNFFVLLFQVSAGPCTCLRKAKNFAMTQREHNYPSGLRSKVKVSLAKPPEPAVRLVPNISIFNGR